MYTPWTCWSFAPFVKLGSNCWSPFAVAKTHLFNRTISWIAQPFYYPSFVWLAPTPEVQSIQFSFMLGQPSMITLMSRVGTCCVWCVRSTEPQCPLHLSRSLHSVSILLSLDSRHLLLSSLNLIPSNDESVDVLTCKQVSWNKIESSAGEIAENSSPCHILILFWSQIASKPSRKQILLGNRKCTEVSSHEKPEIEEKRPVLVWSKFQCMSSFSNFIDCSLLLTILS